MLGGEKKALKDFSVRVPRKPPDPPLEVGILLNSPPLQPEIWVLSSGPAVCVTHILTSARPAFAFGYHLLGEVGHVGLGVLTCSTPKVK